MTTTIKKIIAGVTVMMMGFGIFTSTAFAAPREQLRDDLREARQDFHQEITDEQKEILDEARALSQDGDHDGAKALLEEAGITLPRQEVRDDIREEHEAVQSAIEAGDYAAFLEATENGPVETQLTEEEFEGLVEVHSLRESGDHKAARELAEDLGLPMMGKRVAKRFADNLTDEQKEILDEARALSQDGDHDGAKALLEEAGITLPQKQGLLKRIGNFFRKNQEE